MAKIDILIPAYRGIQPTCWTTMTQMMAATECRCAKNGERIHRAWECNRGKHSLFTRPHVQSCIVHWSRNKLVGEFLWADGPPGRPPAEWALLMDDDMAVLPHFLTRLLSHKLDIVAGICTRRRDPPSPTIKSWNSKDQGFTDVIEWDWDSQKLIDIPATGLAFALIHRRVFERMNEAFLSCEFERARDAERFAGSEEAVERYWVGQADKRRKYHEQALAEGRHEAATCWWFENLWDPTGNERGELGEDISFCWKARSLGFKIYADPQVCPGHLGEYAYSARDWRAEVEAMKARGDLPENLNENKEVGEMPSLMGKAVETKPAEPETIEAPGETIPVMDETPVTAAQGA